MPASIEALQRNINALGNRLIHLEDSDKRIETSTTQLESLIEENGGRVQQLENWSRLSDVRWSRQADEWSGRLEVWRAEDEERSRPVLAVSERVLGLQNQVDELKAGTVELLERAGKLEVEERTSLLEKSRLAERVQQLAAGQELARQKLAEEASARWNIEESMHRAMGRLEEAQTLQKTMMSTLDRATLELEQLERDKQTLISNRESDRLLFQSELADLGGRLEQRLQDLQRELMETRRRATDGFRLVFEHRRQLNLSLEANLQDGDQLGWLGTRSKSETLSQAAVDANEPG
jgi:chromosome segregation ATPase